MHTDSLDTMNLDQVIARLARRALLMNAMFGLGAPASLLPDYIHPVLTAAIRALELAREVRWYGGTRRHAIDGLDHLVLSLYADGATNSAGGLLVTAQPRRSGLADGPLDRAVALLAQRAHDMVRSLWRGGPTSQLPTAIHPVIAAARNVDAHWQDRASCTPVDGIFLKPAAQLAQEVRDDIDPAEFAQFCDEVEREARRERGVPEDVQLPVAVMQCGWCGVGPGERHTAIDCVPEGKEVLLTLSFDEAANDEKPRQPGWAAWASSSAPTSPSGDRWCP